MSRTSAEGEAFAAAPGPLTTSGARRAGLTGVAAVLAVAAAARLPYLGARSLWYDEASSWRTASFPLPELVRSLRLNVHMPLYFLTLRGWTVVAGDSVVALRGLSVVFGLATVAGMYWVAREVYDASAAGGETDRRLGRWFALSVAALVALNPFQVNASIDARMYALGTALAAWGAYLLLRLIRGGLEGGWWWAYGAVDLALLYTHHYGAFSVAAHAAFLLGCAGRLYARGERARAAALLARAAPVGLAVLAAYLPGLALLRGQAHRVRENYWTRPLTPWMLVSTCREFFMPIGWPDIPSYQGEAVAAAGVLALACARVAWRGATGERFVLALALLPMAFAALVSLWTPVWEGRFFRFSQLFLLLALALAAWRIAGRSVPLRACLVGLLLADSLWSCAAFWKLRDVPHRAGMRGAMEAVLKAYRPTETIVAASNIHYFVAKYYAPPGVRVRLDEAATREFWGGHLIRADDLITDGQLAEALPRGVWLLGHDPYHGEYAARADVAETTALAFEYDRGVPDWTVFVTRLEGAPVSEAVARLAAAVRDGRIDRIRLSGSSRLADPDLAPLRGLGGLRHLLLDDTRVTDRGLGVLAGSVGLRELSLSGSRVTGEGLACLRGLDRLESLRLDRLSLTNDGLARLPPLPALKELSLWRCGVTDAGVARLAAFPALERLSLDETAVTDEGLRPLSGLKRLRYLSVWRTKVTPEGGRRLSREVPGLVINR